MLNHRILITSSRCLIARFTVTKVLVINSTDYDRNEEHFIRGEYEIEPDAEIQMELLRKYENFRSTKAEINDNISSVELLKIESHT